MKQTLGFLLLCALVALSGCSDGKTYVTIETEHGKMKAELYDSTPKHKENFLKLIKEDYYKDLLFHRVIKGFMIQGGDPDSRGAAPNKSLGMGGPGYTVPAEIAAKHMKGALSAARLGDGANPQRASSGSQFYIVHGKPMTDNELNQWEKRNDVKYTPEERAAYLKYGGAPFLDNQYTVFGMVVEGLDVIDKIAAEQTGRADRPVKDIKMNVYID